MGLVQLQRRDDMTHIREVLREQEKVQYRGTVLEDYKEEEAKPPLN